MRSKLALGLAAIGGAWVVATGCVVNVTGAPCADDSNCPQGQYCTQGVCTATCTNDSTCTRAGEKACAPAAGANQIGTCVDIGGGCLRVQNATACPSFGQICLGSGTCGCPAGSATPVAGAGCSSVGAATCNGSTLFTCVSGGACNVWVGSDCAAQGLICTGASPSALCVCPPVTGQSTAYVDPYGGSDAGAPVRPTGAQTPPVCRYQRLTEALARPGINRVIATGWPIASWQASHAYPLGAHVQPKNPNGHQYVATTAGTSGASEPTWPLTPGAQQSDNGVTWTEAGPAVITFAAEALPLALDAGVTLTTSECPAAGGGGGGNCDPSHYAIVSTAASGAITNVIATGSGDSISGFTVVNRDSAAANALQCSEGTQTLSDLSFVGMSNDGGGSLTQVPVGISAIGTCSPNIQRVAATGYGVAAVQMQGTRTILLTDVVLGDGGVPNMTGVLVYSGDAGITRLTSVGGSYGLDLRSGGNYALTDVDISGASTEGIQSLGNLTASGVSVHDNAGDGLGIGSGTVTIGTSGATPSSFSFNGLNGIHLTAGTVTGDRIVASSNRSNGVFASGGAATLLSPTLSSNGGAGVHFSGGQLTMHGGQLNTNSGAGLRLTGGSTAYVDGTVSVNSNGNPRDGGVTSANVIVGANAYLELDGGTSGGTRSIQVLGGVRAGLQIDGAALFHDVNASNNTDGIDITGTGTIVGHDFTVAANGYTGVAIGSADAGVTLSSFIAQNQVTGVIVSTTNSSVSLSGCSVTGNRFDGINVNATTSTVGISNCDIAGNGASTGAGVYFSSNPGTLNWFNLTVHNNGSPTGGGGAQVQFTSNAAGTYSLHGSSCTANGIWCYPSGSVGLLLGTGVTVSAESPSSGPFTFTNNPPAGGTDYSGTGTLLTGPPVCPAQPSCP